MHGLTNLKNEVNNYCVWAICNVLLTLTVLSQGEEILRDYKNDNFIGKSNFEDRNSSRFDHFSLAWAVYEFRLYLMDNTWHLHYGPVR